MKSARSINEMFGPELTLRRFRLSDLVSGLEAAANLGSEAEVSDFGAFV